MKIKYSILLLFEAFCLTISSCDKGGNEPAPSESFDGLAINEVSPSKSIGSEGWFELYNMAERDINLNGLQVYMSTTLKAERVLVATLKTGTVSSKGWYVVNTTEAGFTEEMLRATFEELTICNTSGKDISSFSVKYDIGTSIKPEDGGSYSKIPDGTGEWVVTATASPGYANYKITPHVISGIVINEVCPSEKWVEIVNGSAAYQDLEYSHLNTKSGDVIYVAPQGMTVAPGERFVIETGDFSLNELVYYSNSDKEVAKFSSAGLEPALEGTSWSVLPDATGTPKLSRVITKNAVNKDETTSEDALVINEVSSPESWVEIFNPTVTDIRTSALKLFGIDASGKETEVHKYPSGTIPANSAVTVSIAVPTYKGFILKSSSGKTLNTFYISDVDDGGTTVSGTSWSRLPNGSGKWYTVKTPTKNIANYGIAAGNTKAVWVFSAAMNETTLDEMCKAGIGHILVNEYALENGMYSDFNAFVKKAEARGQKVHVWVQCFYHGGKWTPATVIDEVDSQGKMVKGHMNQEAFDEIIARAEKYMVAKPYGIHFDYIRFGGTGAKYNGGGLTPYDSINEFTRQITTRLSEIDPNVIFSAALMGEKNNPIAYGQNCNAMSAYLDIIMPMAYISSYHYSYAQNASVANWFADNVKAGTQVWHGFSTYSSSSKGLSAEQMHQDVAYVSDHCPNVPGMAMFRYGIGEFPDFSDLFIR